MGGWGGVLFNRLQISLLKHAIVPEWRGHYEQFEALTANLRTGRQHYGPFPCTGPNLLGSTSARVTGCYPGRTIWSSGQDSGLHPIAVGLIPGVGTLSEQLT